MEDLRADLSDLERRFDVHDAVCGERYREILRTGAWTQRTLLVGFAVMAVALLLGPHDGLLVLFKHLTGG